MLRVLDRAKYLVDDRSFVGLVSNRIERFDFDRHMSGTVRTEKRWSTKHQHVKNVVHAAEAGVIVATNTRGAHFGMNEKTGELIWSTSPIGEGDPAVILPDGRFAFATWGGFFQLLNPATGRPEGRTTQYLTQIRGLQVVEPSGRLLVRQSRLSEPEGRVWRAVSELDIESGKLHQITPETTGQDIWIDPSARFLLSRNFLGRYDKANRKGPPSRFELAQLNDGKSISSHTYESVEVGLASPVWSSDGSCIVLTPFKGAHSGFLFLNAMSLEKQFIIPATDSRSIAFGHSNSEAILCQAPKSKVLDLNELPSWKVLPTNAQ